MQTPPHFGKGDRFFRPALGDQGQIVQVLNQFMVALERENDAHLFLFSVDDDLGREAAMISPSLSLPFKSIS